MTSTPLTSSQQIIRRVLVAACVIFALGMAGSVVGRAASRDEVRPATVTVAAAAVVTSEVAAAVEEANVELASAKLAPEIINETPVNGRELLHDRVSQAAAEARVEAIAPSPRAAVALPKLRTIEMEVTAYCPCTKCCGPKAQGITASGKRVHHNDGKFVAADRKFAFGTKLVIPGYAAGQTVEVLDRGGAIKGNKLDVYFHSHQEALKWGRQKLTVTVVE